MTSTQGPRTRRITIAMIAVALLGLVATGLASAATTPVDVDWAAEAVLSAADKDASAPQTVISADGSRLVVAWSRSDGTHPIVQTRTSADGGATWTSVTDLSAPGQSAHAPQVAASADGTRLTVTWYRYDGTHWIVQSRSSTDAQATPRL